MLAAGDLDPSFSGDGWTLTPVTPGQNDAANAVAVAPDGKLVVVGGPRIDFKVARYNTNGTLDTTFSGDGIVVTNMSSGNNTTNDEARAVAVQSDSKVIAAGIAWTGNNSSARNKMTMARYNANGTLDTTFNGGAKKGSGKIYTSVPGFEHAWINDIALQPDGKIIAVGAGQNVPSPQTSRVVVARYLANGALDNTFDGDGLMLIDPTPGQTCGAHNGLNVALQPDGKIVVSGSSCFQFMALRVNPNGGLDTSFDGDGLVVGLADLPWSEELALQSDGKILVSGEHQHVVRLNANGSLDNGFGAAGIVDFVATFGIGLEEFDVQADDKILFTPAGFSTDDPDNESPLLVGRLNADGSLDTSYGVAGFVDLEPALPNPVIEDDPGGGQIRDLIIQPDGKAVLVGTANISGSTDGNDFLVLRLLGDPPPAPAAVVSIARAGDRADSSSAVPRLNAIRPRIEVPRVAALDANSATANGESTLSARRAARTARSVHDHPHAAATDEALSQLTATRRRR